MNIQRQPYLPIRMSNICFDCCNILRAADKVFSDGYINKPEFEFRSYGSFSSGPFTKGLRGWKMAASEGSCTICAMLGFSAYPEDWADVEDELEYTEYNDPVTWEVHSSRPDWVWVTLDTDVYGYLSDGIYLQKQSMTLEEGEIQLDENKVEPY